MGADGSLIFDTKIDSSGFSSGIKKLGSISKSGLSLLGGAIAGITTAAGAAVTASSKIGSEFESQMSRVKAISGATETDFEKLKEQAMQLGADTAFSATSAAEGMENLAAAGFNTKEIMDAMPGLLDLAAASGEDLATSSDIAASTLRGFGKAASEAGHVADVLAENANRTNSSVADTGEAMKYVAPLARAAGISMEETAAAIGIMANAGIQGSQAGTTLRGAISRLSKPTEDMEAAMEELGISFYDSDGKMKSLADQVAMLEGAMSGLTDEQKNNYLVTLYGQESLSGMLALINEGPESLEALTQSFEECDGSASEAAKTMQDNFAGAIEQMKGSAETLGITIFDSASVSLKDFANIGTQYINDLTESFNNDGIDGLIDTGSKIVVNILSGIAEKTPVAVDMAIQVIDSIIKNLDSNIPEFSHSGMKILSSLCKGIAELLPTLGIFAYDIIAMLISGISEKAPVMLEKGTEILSNLLKGISENAPQIIESGTKMLTDFMGGISEKLPDLIPLALQAVLSIAQGIVENLPTLIDAGINMLTALAQGIIESLPMLIEQAPKIINAFFEALDQGIFKLIVAGANILKALIDGIVENAPILKENAKEIAQAVLNIFLHLDMLRAGKSIIKNLISGIKEFASHPVTSVKEIAGKIKNVFSEFSWSDIGSNIINGIVNGVKNAAGNLARAALDAVTGAWDAMTGWLDIHSPSKKAEKVIGKNWALGIGVGFEKNMPIGDMVGNVNTAMSKIHSSVSALEGGANITKRTDSNPVRCGSPSSGPSFEGIDYNRLQRIVNGANSEKTIILNVDGTEVLRWIVSKNDDHSNRTGGDTIFE